MCRMIDYLRGLFCTHDYELVVQTKRNVEYDYGLCSIWRTNYLFIQRCKKCGYIKVKKVRF